MRRSREDKIKQDNVTGLFKNPSTRPVVFLTGAILIGLVGVGFFTLGKTADEVESSVSIQGTGKVEHRPGVSSDAQHAALQRQANEDALRRAQESGASTLPVLTGNPNMDNPLTLPPQPVAQPPAPLPVQTPPSTPPQQLPPPPVEQQQIVPVAQAAPPTPVSSDVMKQQILGYLNMWAPGPTAYHEYSYVASRNMKEGGDAGTTSPASASGTASADAASAPAEPSVRYVRAGTMIPAMLITPINSDAPGPVLAQVTSGPLAGARLIGNMKVSKESVLVQFTQISKPGWPDTYPVSAIGMDLKSSTALATDVNRHTLQKYVSLLAGTFVSGYGSAMSQTGNARTCTVSALGIPVCVENNQELNSGQIRDAATGETLAALGGDIVDRGQRDTTIKVQGPNGQPLPIKILFMANF